MHGRNKRVFSCSFALSSLPLFFLSLSFSSLCLSICLSICISTYFDVFVSFIFSASPPSQDFFTILNPNHRLDSVNFAGPVERKFPSQPKLCRKNDIVTTYALHTRLTSNHFTLRKFVAQSWTLRRTFTNHNDCYCNTATATMVS